MYGKTVVDHRTRIRIGVAVLIRDKKNMILYRNLVIKKSEELNFFNEETLSEDIVPSSVSLLQDIVCKRFSF